MLARYHQLPGTMWDAPHELDTHMLSVKVKHTHTHTSHTHAHPAPWRSGRWESSAQTAASTQWQPPHLPPADGRRRCRRDKWTTNEPVALSHLSQTCTRLHCLTPSQPLCFVSPNSNLLLPCCPDRWRARSRFVKITGNAVNGEPRCLFILNVKKQE